MAPDRTKLSPMTIYQRCRRYLLDVGISHGGKGYGPRLHDLRHPYVKLRLKNLEPTFVWFRLKIKPVPSKSLLFSR